MSRASFARQKFADPSMGTPAGIAAGAPKNVLKDQTVGICWHRKAVGCQRMTG
jgi:hypothetical protein